MHRSVLAVVLGLAVLPSVAFAQVEYRVLATSKTSTTEKEMNEAADAGFRFGEQGIQHFVVLSLDGLFGEVGVVRLSEVAADRRSTLAVFGKQLFQCGGGVERRHAGTSVCRRVLSVWRVW